jgi:hypothetical protein
MMSVELPKGFEAHAKKFLMTPECLAFLLCADFVYRKPERLLVIERMDHPCARADGDAPPSARFPIPPEP